jgi:WD40 repeat protein
VAAFKEYSWRGLTQLVLQGLGAQALAPAGAPMGSAAQVVAAGAAAEFDALAVYRFLVGQVALSPDAKLLAAGMRGDQGEELKLWDTATGKQTASLPCVSQSLYTLAFSVDAKFLAAGGIESVRVWDLATRQVVATFGGLDGMVNVVAFSRDGKRLAAAGSRQVKVWDLATGRELASCRHHIPLWGPAGLAFSADLTTLAARNYQEIDVWDLATGKERGTLSEHRGEVGWLTWCTQDKTLVAASTLYEGKDYVWKGDVKLWDLATGRERAAFTENIGRILTGALGPDGKSLALLDQSALDAAVEVKLLDVATGRQRVLQAGADSPVRAPTALAFTPEGKLVLVGYSAWALRLWEAWPGKGQ